MKNELIPLALILVIVIINAYLISRCIKLKRQIKNNNDRSNVWVNLYQDSLRGALDICRLNNGIVEDVSWGIKSCACHILEERLVKKQSSDFDDDLILYSDVGRIPSQFLRDEIAKELEAYIVNYAKKNEQSKQQIFDLYDIALKDSNRRVCRFIHNTLFIPGIISMKQTMA